MKKVHTRLVTIERLQFDSQKEMNDWATENMEIEGISWRVVSADTLDVTDHNKTIIEETVLSEFEEYKRQQVTSAIARLDTISKELNE